MTCYNSELPIGPAGPTGPIGPQGPAATLPYKVYTAFLNQTGTNDPLVTILENTIGDIEWTRNDLGEYSGILLGAFVNGKTILQLGITNANESDAWINPNTQIYIIDVNEIKISSDGDDQLTNYLVQIKIYL